MIIANGYIQLQTSIGGGTDKFGRPIEAISEWSSDYPCQILVNNDTRIGRYEDGTFQKTSYKLYLNMMPFNAKRVRLRYRFSDWLGEYDVESVNILEAVQQIEIVVI